MATSARRRRQFPRRRHPRPRPLRRSRQSRPRPASSCASCRRTRGWRPTSSSAASMSWPASTRPCPTPSSVVELSEAGSERDHELPIAYNNLGATQYQLADYPAAEGSYRKSLELLESTQGISSRRLVVPLAGLGAVYAAQDQHAGRGGAFRPRARGEPPRRRTLQPAATAADRAGRGQPLRDQRLRRRRARAHVRAQDRRAELRLRRCAHVAGAAGARGLLREPARVHRGPEHVPARPRRRRSSRASTTRRRSGPWSASRAPTGSSTRWIRTRSTASSRRATK